MTSNIEMPELAQCINWNEFNHSEPRFCSLDRSSACIGPEVCTER